jgi:hypothetical protein
MRDWKPADKLTNLGIGKDDSALNEVIKQKVLQTSDSAMHPFKIREFRPDSL